MSLIYIWNSDILKEPSDLIVQQLNCITNEGKGLSKVISDAIPYANFYPYKIKGKRAPPGTIEVRGDSNNQRVCGMYAQFYPGKSSNKSIGGGSILNDNSLQRIEWFEKCLGLLLEWCGRNSSLRGEISSISFPYNIGCGLAGGDWDKYRDMLESFALSAAPDIKVYIVSIDANPDQEEMEISKDDIETWSTSSLLEYVSNNPIGGGWDDIIFDGLEEVSEKLAMKDSIIYPPLEHVFEPFKRLPFDKVKVLIIGQDPYHGKGQATGVAFAVNEGTAKPPSLRNIIKEAESEGVYIDNIADLLEEGVLLINTSFTVEEGRPCSHSDIWFKYTTKLLTFINRGAENLVVMLWGGHAQSYSTYFDNNRHILIKSAHPSPLSAHRGFFGSKPFTSINKALVKLGKVPLTFQK